MKKIIITTALLTSVLVNVRAQTWTGSSISTTTSGDAAIQGGNIDLNMPGDSGDRGIFAHSVNHSLYISSGSGTTIGAYIGLNASSALDGGAINFNTVGTSGTGFNFYNYSGGVYTRQVNIAPTGQVLIGNTATPSGYLLYVQTGILTEKLKVANSTDPMNWADFVFNKDYNLMPLKDVATYVKLNKHLPEIPTSKEVAQEGIDVAAMDAKLLQKIEELTLYVIQQQKEIDELKGQKKH